MGSWLTCEHGGIEGGGLGEDALHGFGAQHFYREAVSPLIESGPFTSALRTITVRVDRKFIVLQSKDVP